MLAAAHQSSALSLGWPAGVLAGWLRAQHSHAACSCGEARSDCQTVSAFQGLSFLLFFFFFLGGGGGEGGSRGLLIALVADTVLER